MNTTEEEILRQLDELDSSINQLENDMSDLQNDIKVWFKRFIFNAILTSSLVCTKTMS